MRSRSTPILIGLAILAFSVPASAQQPKAEVPQDELAAQVRTQGFACDKVQGAIRDNKRSRPDHAVWVLKCGNATYRISRAPDMLAKIEVLK